MNQVSGVLRRGTGVYLHYCPACEEMHQLPDSWKFNGNLESPTFHPSFKHEGMQTVKVNGKWTGEWVKDERGNTVPFICHYVITSGQIHYQGDCTHSYAGKTVPMVPLSSVNLADDV